MLSTSRQSEVLIISELPLWPLDQGSKVHGCGMARGLSELGFAVRMASVRSTPIADAPAWLAEMLVRWPAASPADIQAFERGWEGQGAWIRRRIASHQGVEPATVAGVVTLVRMLRPAAVIALGQHGPMFLRGLRHAFPDLPTVWYAADDPVLFQLSCLLQEGVAGRHRLRQLMLYALLERSFGEGIDGVIGVSEKETAALARHTRIPHAATIPNGVDTDYYAPAWLLRGMNEHACDPESRGWPQVTPRSLIFWGRMDFEPNVDAVCWFARRIWPRLRERHPDATWSIVGKQPAPAVQRLHTLPGVTVTGETADIRPHAYAASAVVLPMRCGGGIKNKLLEAAALARPIVATPKALEGLELPAGDSPMVVCRRDTDWIDAFDQLWADPPAAEQLGRWARDWVCAHHTWRRAAERLLDLFECVTHRPLHRIAAQPPPRHRAA